MRDTYISEYSKLNKEQREVVDSIDTNLVTLSPAGTGKTKAIAMRVGNLIKRGVTSSEILCLTFTNKACNEMKERIVDLLGKEGLKVNIKTFHSFCFNVLRSTRREYSNRLIFDEDDCKEIISQINKKNYKVQILQNFISEIKLYSLKYDDESIEDLVNSYFAENEKDISKKLSLKSEDYKLLSILKKHGHILFKKYNYELETSGGLDFDDLIVETNKLFEDKDTLSMWREKFTHINIDEVQDTSVVEYEIISKLAQSKNTAIYGDLNQTIYQWRGSNPHLVLECFKKDFSPVKEIHLSKNYRATKNLIAASNSYLRNQGLEIENLSDSSSYIEGSKIIMREEETLYREGEWIANKIKSKYKDDLSNVAILTRSNKINKTISLALTENGVDCFLVEQYKFFRRQEIKDILAYLKLIVNSYDFVSMKRIAKRFVKNVGEKTIQQLESDELKKVGLRITDFLDRNTIEYDDTYRMLLDEITKNNVVVFDVESTGTDTINDEIIQIAAVRFDDNGQEEHFERLIKSTRSVGASEHVHGFSDEVIQEKGEEASLVLSEFLSFVKGSVLVGHNINFDISILKSHLNRLNIKDLDIKGYYDTLDIARKLYYDLESHKLETLSKELNTKTTPDHNAMNDVLATKDIMLEMIDKLKDSKEERKSIIAKNKKNFIEFYEMIRDFREKLDYMRPSELLSEVVAGSKIKEYYSSEENEDRLKNIDELLEIFKEIDKTNQNLSPREAMLDALKFTALSNSELDRATLNKNKVSVITVHQAKGLEFDTVFISGLVEYTFPSYMSIKDKDISEEVRLFYVAMTRAKKDLYFTWHYRDNGAIKRKSSFIDAIDWEYKEIENL